MQVIKPMSKQSHTIIASLSVGVQALLLICVSFMMHMPMASAMPAMHQMSDQQIAPSPCHQAVHAPCDACVTSADILCTDVIQHATTSLVHVAVPQVFAWDTLTNHTYTTPYTAVQPHISPPPDSLHRGCGAGVFGATTCLRI